MNYKNKLETFKEWEDTTEKQEFKYPMWFKSKETGDVIEFSNLTEGTYKIINTKYTHYFTPIIGKVYKFREHTRKDFWEQVEDPNKDLDSIVDEAIKEVTKEEFNNSINNGGKTDYYQLSNAPFSINDFDDFAEWRNLNGNQFNMGKVMWTFNVGRHNGTDYERDLNKIIHYAKRELLRLKRGKK